MALDSIYRVKESKENTDQIKKVYDYKRQKSLLDTINDIIDRPETGDLDQKWVKENEAKETKFSTPTPKTEDEQAIDDILAKFKKIRELNNNMRSQMRIQQIQESQQRIDSMSGGKSR